MKLPELQTMYPTVNVGQALNVLPEYNAVFVTNPKAGCTTVKLMLQRAHLDDPGFDPGVRPIHDNPVLPKPSEVGWPRVMEMLSGSAYRFTFVRDPIRRAYSAYYDKLLCNRDAYMPAVMKALGRPVDMGDTVTFSEFVSALEMQKPEEMDQHWRPQHINIMHGAISYDAIGKVETFAADWNRIREEIGLPPVPLAHSNGRSPRFDPAEWPEAVKRLRRIYARDFELFGY